jgi:DNA-binding transcriptional ArsR family regulator
MKCKDAALQDISGALGERSEAAAAFLKSLANPSRLLILCALAEGEKNVGDLIEATGIAPTSMSQHLGRLKEEGVIDFQRDHRTLTYFISHPAAVEIMGVLYVHFCGKD